MKRRQNSQTISWFTDIYKRDLLNLNPEYQRRSVWNQEYKDYFIDTILLEYPSPPIFLYEDIDRNGVARYDLVDGKQRLTAVFEFIDDRFPVSDEAKIKRFRGKYFSQLDDEDRIKFYNYPFTVEYLPTTKEDTINDIFDRINRNVARLTPQELRHARLSGEFIKTAEDLTEFLSMRLPANFPRFNPKAQRQMKDVEFTSHLLLLLEEGPKGYSQDDLDKAFTDRDTYWDRKQEIETLFREVIQILEKMSTYSDEGQSIPRSRLHNQADFYSLFGAIAFLHKDDKLPPIEDAANRVLNFIDIVENDEKRSRNETAKRYYEATRAASNDSGPRTERIEIIKSIICDT
ncbi:MAG: DUF262 domain-containing protein [Methanothrix sp.]|nr:DUF262 domain-containing protein [Methanothrix sp.]